MKTTVSTLLAFFLSVTLAFGQAEIIKNETDEFTGNRLVQTDWTTVTVQESGDEPLYSKQMSVFYNEGRWMLVLVSTSDSWAFLGTDTTYFLADGEQFERQFGRGETKVEDRSVREQYIVVFTEDMRSAFERADRVRMKAGSYVLDITDAVDGEIEAIRNEIQ